jgi:nitrate/nitrite-specific signal transduction histidine kinase
MRERAISVGADFEVTSKPGEGTHIYVQGDVPDNPPELGHLQP